MDEKKRILLVDDEEIVLEIYTVFLKKILKFDYEVNKAMSGKEAIQLLRNKRFDLVITGLVMPGLVDGFDVLNEVNFSRNLGHYY